MTKGVLYGIIGDLCTCKLKEVIPVEGKNITMQMIPKLGVTPGFKG
jgi:hypothetical protein